MLSVELPFDTRLFALITSGSIWRLYGWYTDSTILEHLVVFLLCLKATYILLMYIH